MTALTAAAMRDHAFDQRERMARQLFDFNAVADRIKEAATAGQTDVRIVQDAAVDLSVTLAGIKLTAMLQKRGFVIAWKPTERHKRGKGRPGDEPILYCELVIDWSGIKSLGGFLSRSAELGLSVAVEAPVDKNSSDGLAAASSETNT